MQRDIRIATEPFDPEAEVARFRQGANQAGAIVSFTGIVRPSGAAGAVSALTLQHYPGMTERGIADMVEGAAARWPLDAVLIIHRTGELLAREPIVLVATASRHRRAAFEAADYLMDYLKSRALFWKNETGTEGKVWIEPRDDDYADAARWDDPGR